MAVQYGIRSIAFPAISTGIYGFPSERAARIAIQTVTTFLENNAMVERVVLVAFDERTEGGYRAALEKPNPLE